MSQTTRGVDGPAAAADLGSVRTWLAVDATLTGTNGAIYVLAARPLVELLGGVQSTWWIVGAFLLVFTALVARVARSSDPIGPASRVVAIVNSLWVLASLAVAVTGALDLTTTGRAWAALQGVVVAVVTVLQLRTGRRR